MNRIPQDFIHTLLSRINIVDLIDARVPLQKKSSNNFFACCPFHNEKSPSFSVSLNKQFYHCFGCGAHGNAIDFVMQFDHFSFPEAIAFLAKDAGLVLPTDTTSSSSKKTISTDSFNLLVKISDFYQDKLRKSPIAIAYLKQRGLTGDIAKTFGLGFAPPGWENVLRAFGDTSSTKKQLFELGMLIKKDDGNYYDRFRERIMFPILDPRGQTIGFGGRILEQGEPKYLNSPETPLFQKGNELYGFYQVLKANRHLTRALIVEGYMDVIALAQFGIHYAVATLGTATTAQHLRRLSRHTSEIVCCFDGDTAGRTAGWRALLVALPLLQANLQIRFMFLPEGEDPDSLIRKEGKTAFEKRINDATSLSHFFFQHLSTQADLSHLDGRARFIQMAKEHIMAIPEGVFRDLMLEELAKKGQVASFQLKQSKKLGLSPNRFKARAPSNLRLILTLLVQDPSLAFLLEEALPPVETKGFDLLIRLVDSIKNHALKTTSLLFEHWRDYPERDLLAKLEQLSHMIPPDGIKNEFLGAIRRLKKQSNKQQIDKLLAKAAQQDLSAEEKSHLNSLIMIQNPS